MATSFVIYPIGGLCARLKVLLSWKYHADVDERSLICYWPKSKLCNGLFSECFEPIDNVEFRYCEPDEQEHIDYEGTENCGALDLNAIRPLPHLMQRIEHMTRFMKDYDAIHVRRTDFDDIAHKRNIYMKDAAFCKFIADGNKMPTYLSTDNVETQIYFAKEFTGIIRIHKALIKTAFLRHSSLDHAVVDMFVCAASKFFMGTSGSAFSWFIEQLRSSDSPYSPDKVAVNNSVIPPATPAPVPPAALAEAPVEAPATPTPAQAPVEALVDAIEEPVEAPVDAIEALVDAIEESVEAPVEASASEPAPTSAPAPAPARAPAPTKKGKTKP